MKIPDRILLAALEHHFGTHRCWHVARLESQEELRRKFPGECGSRLYSRGEPESGCDFLHYHRRMIRHFKWVIANTSGVTYRYDPWTGPRVPDQIEKLLQADGFDLAAAYQGIEELVAGGTASDLGGFIEANIPGGGRPGSAIHAEIHWAIHDWESDLGGDPDADMGDMGTAPANEYFWKLHGWIDELYANWQRAHGETVDQSPAPMHDPHVKCDPTAPSLPPHEVH